MGSWDPCLGEDSTARLTELVLIVQHGGLVVDSMGTSLCSLQAAIIDNSDISKNWGFIVPWM
jgi:hypothetical protein